MKITRAVVPSLFTTLNVYCGFLSIVNASQSRFEMAAWFIILAGVFDSLDGVMARITRSSSQFGVELDSLADVVSFGVAPSFLVWKVHLHSLGEVGLLLSAFPLIFGAIRLARFNTQLVGFDKDHFNGLPIPAQAVTLCSFLLLYTSEENGLTGWPQIMLAPLTALLGLLMVSRVKYDTLPKLTKKDVLAHPWKVVSFGVAGLLVIFSKGEFMFFVLISFILLGVGRSAIAWMRRRGDADVEEEAEASSIDV